MVTLEEYKKELKKIKIGKRVGKNIYILWPDLVDASPTFESILKDLGQVGDTVLIKFFLDQLKVSYLQYPDFFVNPHPVLYQSETVDLSTGKRRVINYSNSCNPPILHRKETMISSKRSEYKSWVNLTETLESHGCYEETRKIGFKNFWDELLLSKGLTYKGHNLITGEVMTKDILENKKVIHRHKTAISRVNFSKPLQLLLRDNLLKTHYSYFDYGCGLGDDINALLQNGFNASGWDPVHNPTGKKVKSDIVNVGFVLNVIESFTERIQVLEESFNLAMKILSIAVVTDSAPTAKDIRPYKDGFLTSRGTFQKFFKHEEIQELIEETLNYTAHAVAPGIFFIFKKEQDAQDFLLARQTRRINWNQLNLNIYPTKDAKEAIRKDATYSEYKDEIEEYWEQLLVLGRIPTDIEYPRGKELKEKIKFNSKKLLDWFLERYGKDVLEEAFEKRRKDLLVYLGLSNFKKKIPLKALSNRLQQDMKTYFGSYKAGQQEALTELFNIGRPDVIESKCNDEMIGRIDDQALYITSQQLYELDPILRMYVGVAGLLYGNIEDVDEIKIHKRSSKVTFIIRNASDLDDNEYIRIKVDLIKQKFFYFKHKEM